MKRFFSGEKLQKLIFANSMIFNFLYLLFCCSFVFIGDLLRGLSFNIVLPIFVFFALPLLYFSYVMCKGKEGKFLEFFFCIEMPLFYLCLFRIFSLKEFSAFYVFLFVSILISIMYFVCDIFNFKFHKKHKTLANIALETPVILSSYFLIISAFLIIPLFVMVIKFIFSAEFISFVKEIVSVIIECFSLNFFACLLSVIYMLLLIAFFVSILLLFFVTPFVTVFLYMKRFLNSYKEHRTKKACVLFAIFYIFLSLITSFHFSIIQTENDYTKVKQANNYAELQDMAKNVLRKKGLIKLSLLDDYLSEIRYVTDANENRSINRLYEDAFNSRLAGEIANYYFKLITYPFNYPYVFRENKASSTYEEFFDEDIQYGESKKIYRALNSTFFGKKINATLMDRSSLDVVVLSRNIEINKTDDSSIYKVSFTEEYKNKSNNTREVYIDFSLPKNAVITSLHLGNNLEYEGVLAPKGAARKTYENELKRRYDPALLEKNGLYQYNLRIYPVVTYRRISDIQKINFEYLVDAKEGIIPLPNIYETRNAYFPIYAKYSVKLDNKKLKISKNKNEIEVQSTSKKKKLAPKNKRLAVLMDTSYSNKIKWDNYIKGGIEDIFNDNNTEYYFFNKYLSNKLSRSELKNQINFSKTARYDAYCSLENKYDAVIMLTDSSMFDSSTYNKCGNSSPLYVVHIDKDLKLPPYKTEFTNLIYKTNGNIGSDIFDIFDEIENIEDNNIANNSSFIAQNKIDKILRSEDLNEFKTKDKIYNIAKEGGIVSNYSSYIALVNLQQFDNLKNNQKSKDKYDANLEFEKETSLQSNNETDNDIASTPEPEEWLLIIALSLFVILFASKNRLKCLFQK